MAIAQILQTWAGNEETSTGGSRGSFGSLQHVASWHISLFRTEVGLVNLVNLVNLLRHGSNNKISLWALPAPFVLTGPGGKIKTCKRQK